MNEIELYNKSIFYLTRSVWNDWFDQTYAVVKGVPLSQLCYGDIGKRKSIDIDVLISKESVQRFETVLISKGFTPLYLSGNRESRIFHMACSHQITPYYKIVDDSIITIDINHSIMWGEYEGEKIDVDEFCSDCQTMNIAGARIKILSPMKALIHLILHAYKDMNSIYILASRKKIDRCAFRDIYTLLVNNIQNMDMNVLYEYCHKLGVVPYIFYMLYYTNILYGSELLGRYVEKFKTQEGLLLLNSYGLCAKERKQWGVDFLTRLDSEDLFRIIKDDLSKDDLKKIEVNKYFLRGRANESSIT